MSIKDAYIELNQLSQKSIEDSNYRNRYGISIMSVPEKERLNQLNEAFNEVVVNIVNFFVVDYVKYASECVDALNKLYGIKASLNVKNVLPMINEHYSCEVYLEDKQNSELFVKLDMLDGDEISIIQKNPLNEDLHIGVDLRRQEEGLSRLIAGENSTKLQSYISSVTWRLINEAYDREKRRIAGHFIETNMEPQNNLSSQPNMQQSKKVELTQKQKIKIIGQFDKALEESIRFLTPIER